MLAGVQNYVNNNRAEAPPSDILYRRALQHTESRSNSFFLRLREYSLPRSEKLVVYFRFGTRGHRLGCSRPTATSEAVADTAGTPETAPPAAAAPAPLGPPIYRALNATPPLRADMTPPTISSLSKGVSPHFPSKSVGYLFDQLFRQVHTIMQ